MAARRRLWSQRRRAHPHPPAERSHGGRLAPERAADIARRDARYGNASPRTSGIQKRSAQPCDGRASTRPAAKWPLADLVGWRRNARHPPTDTAPWMRRPPPAHPPHAGGRGDGLRGGSRNWPPASGSGMRVTATRARGPRASGSDHVADARPARRHTAARRRPVEVGGRRHSRRSPAQTIDAGALRAARIPIRTRRRGDGPRAAGCALWQPDAPSTGPPK